MIHGKNGMMIQMCNILTWIVGKVEAPEKANIIELKAEKSLLCV